VRLRDVVRRERLDAALDRLRFRIDTFPRGGRLARFSHVGYQPLPWVGIPAGSRATGTVSRWAAIERELDGRELRTAMDLGANTGFFTIKLAERGLATVAVEGLPVAYRTALYAFERAGVRNTALLAVVLEPETLDLLPEADVTLFLSLWHHFVRAHGLETATEMLARIWEHTRSVMFFDTGENEMPPEFGLPRMEPDAETWLSEFLRSVCPGANVRSLGQHDAFDAERRPTRRTLLVVTRD
jgi:SAM-dependent methyltransferase